MDTKLETIKEKVARWKKRADDLYDKAYSVARGSEYIAMANAIMDCADDLEQSNLTALLCPHESLKGKFAGVVYFDTEAELLEFNKTVRQNMNNPVAYEL